jgi:hypothetical protein
VITFNDEKVFITKTENPFQSRMLGCGGAPVPEQQPFNGRKKLNGLARQAISTTGLPNPDERTTSFRDRYVWLRHCFLVALFGRQ